MRIHTNVVLCACMVNLIFPGSSQIIAQYYQLIRLGFEVIKGATKQLIKFCLFSIFITYITIKNW